MKIINVIMFVVMIAMNYLANALPLNNRTTGEISEQYSNLFVPAGITFSIWGVIYIMLLVFCIIQFLSQNKALVEAVGWAFAISCFMNALWIVAWHYDKLPLSLIIMIGLLATLVYINFQLKGEPAGLTKAAFGIYLGWICIATIANVTALLVKYNWGGWGIPEVSWTIIMIFAGLAITAVTLYRLNNPFIGLAVFWAFAGIVIKRMGDTTPAIAIVAASAALIMAALTVWMFIKRTNLA